MSASQPQRTAQATGDAACEGNMSAPDSGFVGASPKTPASGSSETKKTSAETNGKIEDQKTPDDAGTGKKRKVRFSLPEGVEQEVEAEEDVNPAAATKKRKVEARKADGAKVETASAQVVKDWAKSYCENVLECSTKAPWDLDSDDESETEDEAVSGGVSSNVDESEDEDKKAEDESIRKSASAPKATTGQEVSDEVEAHGLRGSPDGTGSASKESRKVTNVTEQESTKEVRVEKLHAYVESAQEDAESL